MAFHITKISQKVFTIFIVALITLGGYFAIISYAKAVENAEHTEIIRLKGIVHTFSVQAENVLQITDKSDSDLSKLLFKASRSNSLEQGLQIVSIDIRSGNLEELGSEIRLESKNGSYTHQYLIAQQPTSPIVLGIDDIPGGSDVAYAYPIASTSAAKAVYLIAQENISEQLHAARIAFFKQIAFSIFILISIVLLGFKAIKKIFRHEVSSKRTLANYVQLAENSTSELETMSIVLKNCDNLILLTDKNGKIEWLNESYQRKNNFSETELETFVGRQLLEVSHYGRIQEVINQVNKFKEKWTYETKSYDTDKKEFWASTTVTPILDKEGEVEKLIFIDADITRIKMAEMEIAKMANFAQENTSPLIRIKEDGTVLYANDPGKKVLNLWNASVDDKLEKPIIIRTIQLAMEAESEQRINLECDNRIYCLRFTPMADKAYVNIYGEDITEVQIAEKITQNRSHQLEQSQLNITDSITYARTIQEAILPNEDQIRQYFKDSFVMSKPKDIVSGDFFWIHEEVPNEKYIIALADCTGHGVPGAMMSIVGHGILNELVEKQKNTDPAEILRLLNREIIRSLKQKSEGDNSDGMDISIVRIDLKNLEVTYAGAYQPIYWMNGKLNIFKGDRQPIGGIHHDTNRIFTNHKFQVCKGDSLYLTSDGFVDQFGGPNDKKFKSCQFEKMLQKSHKFSMQAQSYLYENEFNDWKGRQDQVDDVSMIGIKF